MVANNPRMCIIGAGFSGLCMAIQLKTKLNIESFTIYEALKDVGGTWLANTYPGSACDIPSHLYSFSFCPKYDWSQVYSSQTEILEYIRDVTKKYDLYPFIKFQSKVECLRWDELEMKWHATILTTDTNNKTEETFDIIVNGTGRLRIPNYPPEFVGFNGDLLHSANWDSSVSLKGKRVGIVGTGASAVQIITTIAPEVKQLFIFQRQPPFVLPRPQMNYSEMSKWGFANIPGLYRFSRAYFFWLQEAIYGGTRYNSRTNKLLEKITRWFRNREIENSVLREKATPNYTVICKRAVLSENYYSTLVQDNVDLITEGIKGLKGNLVKTNDGKCHELDVLILATGFKVHDFFAPMRITGKDGVDVLEKWQQDRPQGYLGILSRAMPNFFTLLGPYTAVGHSSNVFTVECQVDWTIQAIKKMRDKGARVISITERAENEFMQYIDKTMEGSVWTSDQCGAWYLDHKGRNTTLWPGSQVDFWRKCRTIDESLFEFEN